MSATPKTQMEFAPEYDKPVRYMQRTREWYLTLDTTLGGIRHSGMSRSMLKRARRTSLVEEAMLCFGME